MKWILYLFSKTVDTELTVPITADETTEPNASNISYNEMRGTRLKDGIALLQVGD